MITSVTIPTEPALVKTSHFDERQRQRSIPDSLVRLALAYGERFFQGDQRVYFLGRKHLRRIARILNSRQDDGLLARADGTVVVTGADDVLITAYRNPKYIRHLRRCM